MPKLTLKLGAAGMIALVDYRAGNLASVKKALEHVGASVEVTSEPGGIARADRIVLPGVGHFSATQTLTDLGLRQAILEAMNRSIPFLGICVGMQWMMESSAEAPATAGLGLWKEVCEKFPGEVKSPHVGWNQLEIRNGSSPLLKGVPSQSFVYFTHSYRVPLLAETVAHSEYGGKFSAVVEKGRTFGVQFHPEKSGPAGLQVLENFCRI